jgi:hypothetical protein
MPTFARIADGIVAELFTPPTGVALAQCFVASLVSSFVAVPAGVTPQQGWTFDGTTFAAPVIASPPAAPPPTVLTFNQLISQFTPQEQGALATAAQSNPQIFLWMTMGAAANRVDLADPQTTGGMDVLEAAGILTAARCDEILTPKAL